MSQDMLHTRRRDDATRAQAAAPGGPPPARNARGSRKRLRSARQRPNVLAGLGATLWLLVVGVPLYFVVITSVRERSGYLSAGPLSLPETFTLENYALAFEVGFGRFLLNSAIVTVATVALVVSLALPAAYAIVRSRSRAVRTGFSLFLLGLAIPAQAVIIPLYLIITRFHLYDTLIAIILPTAAFALPISIVVLTSSLRDVPRELYEAMTVDGAGPTGIFLRLVLPLARPGMVTVGIFAGLQAWNGFLFPLVMTQSQSTRVLPLGLWEFQGQYGTNVPGIMAAVVISAIPIFALYIFARRQLLGGLAAGFSK